MKLSTRIERKADTARWLPMSILGWTLSYIVREIEHHLR